MGIKNWPEQERPREKLLSKGASTLSDAELIAIFLRSGVKGKSALDMARDLLKQFGSLQKLFHVTSDEFCYFPGLGLAKYTELQAILELIRRYLFESAQMSDAMAHVSVVKQFLSAKLAGMEQEVFGCLFLNNKHRIIAFKELFYGSIDRSEIYPREVVKAALAHNAAAVIFTHNHPSGDPTPSDADLAVTEKLKTALALIDTRVLDHIIVGSSGCVSLTETGFL